METKEELLKLIILTRGRTGSTAIINQLGKSRAIHSEQELFSKDPNLKYYKDLPPFSEWTKKTYFRLFLKKENLLANRYLNVLHNKVCRRKIPCFIWKALSNNLIERPYLIELLKLYDYKIIYLKRNIARQVISGMIANERRVYNSLDKIEDEKRYLINIDYFRKLVEWENHSVMEDVKKIEEYGFDFIKLSYEKYINEKKSFLGEVFRFIRLPEEDLAESDFQIMIPDISNTVENFEEVSRIAEDIGEPIA